jgi:8-oxo-dGTP pyrophosphatase MutT (NUDIX family)
MKKLLEIIDEVAKEHGLEWHKPQSAEPIKKSEDFSRVSSIIVATDDKMLMLQRRDNGKWTFPGGHLNDDETHLEGAVRELWEEAGIRANPDEMILLGSKKTFQNKDIHVYLYKVNSEVKPSAANDPDKEAQKFAWLPHVLPEDIKENLYIPVGDNSSLSMFSVWLLRQKANKLKKLVESKKSV